MMTSRTDELDAADIIGYLHCGGCGTGDMLSVGLLDTTTVVILCEECALEVNRFKLKEPMEMPVCKDCGKPLGQGHKH